jgi:hypothetical protein
VTCANTSKEDRSNGMDLGRAFLAVGPVSRNVVDATLTVAYRCDSRIMLIPSRSQVDAEEFGKGYLGWSTEEFARYVRARDPQKLVLLCRDHGGPWQHPAEASVPDEKTAMESCIASYGHDIDAGFDLVHIDTSAEQGREAPFEAALRRLMELLECCSAKADAAGRPVRYEIGLEPQRVDVNDPGSFEAQLDQVRAEIVGRELPLPSFVVAQTGTKVRELSNCGAFGRPGMREAVAGQVAALARICLDRGCRLKAHNCDYLAPQDIAALVSVGVCAINVAPELGTCETRILLRLLHEIQLPKLADRFLALSFESGKWSKWMGKDTMATDCERAVIAGHYVFETGEFHEIRSALERKLARRTGVSLADLVQAEIGLVIERYLVAGTAQWYPSPRPRLLAR